MNDTAQILDSAAPGELRRLALERLRYERLMGVEFVPRVAVAIAAAVPALATRTASAPHENHLTPASNRMSIASAQQRAAAQLAAAAPLPKAAPPPGAPLTPELAERWRVLEAQARACETCPLIAERRSVVFGSGNRSARLLFVGQGPGEEEERLNDPLKGKGGELLDKILGAMKLSRAEVYLCNVIGCRTPRNRPPLPNELAACAPHLLGQIELVAPQVIVSLGECATNAMLNSTVKIGAARGRWLEFRGIPVMPTFHPAFVAAYYTPEIRGQVWSDMQQVLAKLA